MSAVGGRSAGVSAGLRLHQEGGSLRTPHISITREPSVPHFERSGTASSLSSPPPESPDDGFTEEERERLLLVDQYAAVCRQCHVTPVSLVERALFAHVGALLLRNLGLGGHGARALAVFLVKNHHVKQLDLSENNLGQVGTKSIAEMLTVNTTLEELDLSENKVTGAGLRALCSTLLTNTTLHVLRLDSNGIQGKDMLHLIKAVENTHSLRELSLAHNQVDGPAATKLGSALKKNSSLEKLDLSWNLIRDSGAVDFARALATNHTLTKLDISWNGFAQNGCVALGEALRKNRSLVELNLLSNRIHAEAVTCLLKGLNSNHALKTLRLGRNPLTPLAAFFILTAIGKLKSRTLTCLDLEDIVVDDEFMDLLAKVQVTHPHLQVLYGTVTTRRGLRRREVLDIDPASAARNNAMADEIFYSIVNKEGLKAVDDMLDKEMKIRAEYLHKTIMDHRKAKDEEEKREAKLKFVQQELDSKLALAMEQSDVGGGTNSQRSRSQNDNSIAGVNESDNEEELGSEPTSQTSSPVQDILPTAPPGEQSINSSPKLMSAKI